jgi:type II secretory pathway component GspD/PulD (secretin)
LRRAVCAALAAGVLGLAGCETPKPPPVGGGLGSLFDPSIVDLVNKQIAERPIPPEPKIIEQGEKSTLVYRARHARTEVLKDAVGGLLNPDGTIQDSAALNSLVIQDRTDVIKNVLGVLQSLDNPTAQLLVEARVVEVTLTDDLEYEITHTLTIPNSPGALLQNSQIDLSVPGANPTPGQGIDLHIRPWASKDIRLDNFIRLLESRGKANILSSPNVIVAPGTEASIITGQEVPIQSQTTVAGAISTSTVYKRVGIKLRVALQQLTEDTARLEINPEVSQVTGFTQVSQGVSNPLISLRNVSSTLSLKDGEVLTIGGLLENTRVVDTRGIPWLQDIPHADFLFQSKRDQTNKTQLIFFLRVHILAEGVPDGVRVHKPGTSLDNVARDPTLLNPNSTTQPTLKEVTDPVPVPPPAPTVPPGQANPPTPGSGGLNRGPQP